MSFKNVSLSRNFGAWSAEKHHSLVVRRQKSVTFLIWSLRLWQVTTPLFNPRFSYKMIQFHSLVLFFAELRRCPTSSIELRSSPPCSKLFLLAHMTTPSSVDSVEFFWVFRPQGDLPSTKGFTELLQSLPSSSDFLRAAPSSFDYVQVSRDSKAPVSSAEFHKPPLNFVVIS